MWLFVILAVVVMFYTCKTQFFEYKRRDKHPENYMYGYLDHPEHSPVLGFDQALKMTPKQRYNLYIKNGLNKPLKNFSYLGSSSNVDKQLVREFLLAARLSAIAYYTEVPMIVGGLDQLGLQLNLKSKLLGYVFNESCQAYVATLGDLQILAIRGTEFTEAHHNIWEVWDDLKSDPINVKPKGSYVHAGFYEEFASLWPSIAPLLDYNKNIWIVGHSLGGVRAHLARAFIPHTTSVRITTFGGPKGANFDFWDANMDYNTIIERVVAERDFAPDFPWVLPFFQPEESFYWLTQGTINKVLERDYINVSLDDHRLTSSYLPLLENAAK